MGGSKRKIDDIPPTSPPKPKRSRETLKQNMLQLRKGKGKAIAGGSEGLNNDKMGDSDERLLDVEGKIRAKERKTAEVSRKKKTEKGKVKGGEVAIEKGRKGKGGKGKRGEGVEKDKGDGIEWDYGRDYGREDKAGKGGRGIYSEDDRDMEVGKGRGRGKGKGEGSERYKDKGKKKGKCKEILEKGKQEMKSAVDAETSVENGLSMAGMCPMSRSVFHVLNILF